MFHLICLLYILLILVSVELSLCIVLALSQDEITCFLSRVEYKIVMFYFMVTV